MKALSRLGKKKKALSNVVGYVLLISITISLSVLVYGWLKFYVSEEDIATCPDGISIIIKDYGCIPSPLGADSGYLSITLKNKGLFKVDGYSLRVHDRPDADFGFYTFNDTGVAIMPGGEDTGTYYFADKLVDDGKALKEVTLVEVQPFIIKEDQVVNCGSHITRKIECQYE
ncbi:MAG: archaellin/type IV pilin N-terminal domain-containing protein [archaeon]